MTDYPALIVEEGAFYHTRAGHIVGPMRRRAQALHSPQMTIWPWKALGWAHWHRDDGTVSLTPSASPSPYDLVEKVAPRAYAPPYPQSDQAAYESRLTRMTTSFGPKPDPHGTGVTISARCQPCGFVWVVVHLPMDVVKAATAMSRATCPRCGETEQLFLARDVPDTETTSG
jgi:hypothetical protein